LEANVKDIKNEFYLAKLLEAVAALDKPDQVHTRGLASKAEIQLIKLAQADAERSALPLTIAFQALSASESGEEETWKFLLTYFAKAQNLQKLDLFILVVKFIPSLAMKTKQLYKDVTNISNSAGSHRRPFERQVSSGTQKSLETI